jgi:hypothetical protein
MLKNQINAYSVDTVEPNLIRACFAINLQRLLIYLTYGRNVNETVEFIEEKGIGI